MIQDEKNEAATVEGKAFQGVCWVCNKQFEHKDSLVRYRGKPTHTMCKEAKKEKRQTGKESKFAYKIKDKSFADLEILNTANAWWLDKTKVVSVINAYKIDATDEEACAFAGISLRQLQYFKELHKNFCDVKAACKELPVLKARQTLVKDLDSPDSAKWYLERKKKKEFSTRQEMTGEDGVPLFNMGEVAKMKLKKLK